MATNTRTPSAFVVTRRQNIQRTLSGLKVIPSNAAVAMKVMELKRRSSAGAAQFAQVIAADPALAAKVLGVANSTAFAPAQPVTRLSTAIANIGLAHLLPLVFGLSFAGMFNKLGLPPEEQAALWRASLLKAISAKFCVLRLCPGQSSERLETSAENAFVAALLQDISLPVFCAADRSAWPEFLAMLDATDRRAEREIAVYGTDHTAVSGQCARVLGLPDFLASACELHHRGVDVLRGATAGADEIAVALDAAAHLPHRLPSFNGRVFQPFIAQLTHTAGATAEQLVELAREIGEEFVRTAAMFAEPKDAGASFKEFLQNLGTEVAECIQSSILGSATEIHGLKQREQQLGQAIAALEDQAQRAELDPLTRTLTRPAFLSRLARLLPLARKHGAACAIGYLDIDDFKQINDAHGHAGGDAALEAFSARLIANLSESGIAGRMGGDEFVIAFVARPDSMDQAIRNLIEQMKRFIAPIGQAPLEITTSIGIVPLGIPEPQTDPQLALRHADELMYQAKRTGKGQGAVGPIAAQTVVYNAA